MKINVCIVEDDVNLSDTIRRFINLNEGFKCSQVFASGEELFRTPPETNPDVVLMDINLPGMNGIQCVSRLKQIMPDVQIMMLTIYENGDRIFEALAAGASGFLVKNTPPDKLLEAIKDVANGGGPMSSHIARKVIQAFQPTFPNAAMIENITAREREILELLSRGLSYKMMAADLNLSMGTIQTHITRIYKKLHVNCRTEAVMKYVGATSSRPNSCPRG